MPQMKQVATSGTFQKFTTDATIGYKPCLFSSATSVCYFVLDAADATAAAAAYSAGNTFSVPTNQIWEWYIDPTRLWIGTAGTAGVASILIKD